MAGVSEFVTLNLPIRSLIHFVFVPTLSHDELKTDINVKFLHVWTGQYSPPPPHALAKVGDIKTHSSVCLSIPLSACHKNFNLAHIF